MGSTESSTRKVSFGLDEDDRVRVLHGVKLSEDVLQRMRGVAPETDFTPPPATTPKEEPGPPPRTPDPRPTAAEIQEELRRRYEREQAIVREELARITRREREAAREELTVAMRRERANTRAEAERAKQLPAEVDAWAMQLEKKETELKQLETFYREKLAQLEKKNLDFYKQTSEQFREAATRAEAHVKPRNMEPVCTGLQTQILHCYRENQDQTLRCSDLAKEYMQCIDAAKKNLLVNHG
ncbi:MICOS complex subunit mic25a isoform X1 [Megalops cyprinoides]|uniref:MICOS complex subunit mic25a isoform X1 n=1 Tax=Megalops cyprinoides TaxID=118141 RepID=UPI00186466C0|nr:MICOS complex subunit mic25a isoform X1 [Megalops cyprinoides]